MTTAGVREKVTFPSGDDTCAAWHHRGTSGVIVVMAGGFGVTKEPGTDRFAAAFHAAGHSVLAFDYRRLGESGGEPRQVIRRQDQLVDWDAAIRCAAVLPGVEHVAVWGFSLSGGYVFDVAARHPDLLAAVAQTPNADGRAAARNALRYQTKPALVRTFGRALLDAVGGRFVRPTRMIPLDGEPGTVALLTTPDAVGGGRILDPDDRYVDWQQQVAARSMLWVASYRPGRRAERIGCPLLVVVADDDRSALAEPSAQAAETAPHGELVRVPGGHYAPYLDAHDAVVAAELAFLDRCRTQQRSGDHQRRQQPMG